ncbi:hypothetical protein A2G06_16580 (plasmid) [Geobacter anodireducens]|nr:hypothetical protein A2G06_16580 [Geobacter anodireducens]
MKKFMTIATGLALVAAGVATTGANQSPKESAIAELKKQLPNLTAPQITESEISGLFQITAGDQVFYWHPDGFLVLGEIWDVKKGKSLTAEKKEMVRNEREKALGLKIAKLPLEKAVKIGNGKNVVIEFTDPDCPFCRKADDFLSKRDDITRYVFLFPLKNLHPQAAAKSAYILSKKDKAAALRDVFNGAFDKSAVPVFDVAALGQVEENLKMGADLGITGTPVIIVNGSIVRGADLNRVKSLLESRS